MLTFTQVKETCIYVSDLDRTREFYEGKLGLKCFELATGRHAFFKVGTSVFLCFIAEATKQRGWLPTHYGSGEMHFAFEATKEQYDAWRDRIMTIGIVIEQDIAWPRGGKSFYFRDPDNHLVEIVQQGIWDWSTEAGS
jgi:catechol 2,3-dioxygenase-like lactoylglutathione lyase family enzyme